MTPELPMKRAVKVKFSQRDRYKSAIIDTVIKNRN
jgi:hypothetical protein